MVDPPVMLGGDQVSIVFPLIAVSWKLTGLPGWFDDTVRDFDALLVAPSLSLTVRVMVYGPAVRYE